MTAEKTRPAEIAPTLDIQKIRADFPILKTKVHGKPLIYFDNAATTQKPQQVIDALNNYYTRVNSNIHRGVHYLSEQATSAYEDVRAKVRDFINASDVSEVIFTRGTTESVNLVTNTYGRQHVGEGDEVIISEMEHHSNIVPWQLLCEEKGASLRIIPFDDSGELILDEYKKLLNDRTRMVAVVHVSNSLGTINPVKEIINLAHENGTPVLIDGAQATPHMPVDVRDLNCDFYALSGHKMYGPTGIGVLYAREEILDKMSPYQGGGEMIKTVTFEKTTYNDLPHKFEAGTPNIAGTIGLGAAIDYLLSIGYKDIDSYEKELLDYGTKALSCIEGVEIVGNASQKTCVLSFKIENIHPLDIGTLLNTEGIAVRTGHHCTQPVMDHYGVTGTTRASLAFYNTKEELEHLADGINRVIEMFK